MRLDRSSERQNLSGLDGLKNGNLERGWIQKRDYQSPLHGGRLPKLLTVIPAIFCGPFRSDISERRFVF